MQGGSSRGNRHETGASSWGSRKEHDFALMMMVKGEDRVRSSVPHQGRRKRDSDLNVDRKENELDISS